MHHDSDETRSLLTTFRPFLLANTSVNPGATKIVMLHVSTLFCGIAFVFARSFLLLE